MVLLVAMVDGFIVSEDVEQGENDQVSLDRVKHVSQAKYGVRRPKIDSFLLQEYGKEGVIITNESISCILTR